MKKSQIFLLALVLLLTMISQNLFSTTKTNVLYSCSFSEWSGLSGNYSSSECLLNEKGWSVSSARYASQLFWFGGNATESYSIDETEFPDLSEVWKANDAKNEDAKQVFALLFNNEFSAVNNIQFRWNETSGTGKIQVFLFVDHGLGYELEGRVSADGAGDIAKTYDELCSIKRLALVARPGQESSVAKGRCLQLADFEIDGAPVVVTKMDVPTFSLPNESLVWPGTFVKISNKGVANTTVNYSFDGNTYISSANAASVAINNNCSITAFASVSDAENSDYITNRYNVFDINGDFSQWSDNGYPSGWLGGIAKSNVGIFSDPEKGDCMSLTQTSKSVQRLKTMEFIMDAGTYTVSIDMKASESNSDRCVYLQYTVGANSSSYKDIATATINEGWSSLTSEFTIEEQSVVKFSIGLSKNDDVNNTDWSTYFTNLSVVSQYSSFKPIDVAVQNIVVKNGRVLIKGKNGSVANVYNVSGMKLRSQFIDNDDYVLSDLPKNQLLLMVIDNDSKKLILR